jgi:hypothetical protein
VVTTFREQGDQQNIVDGWVAIGKINGKMGRRPQGAAVHGQHGYKHSKKTGV